MRSKTEQGKEERKKMNFIESILWAYKEEYQLYNSVNNLN